MWSILLLLAHLLTLCPILGDQIGSSDIILDYSNAQYVSSISFRFSIQSPLTSTDYLQMKLPFPLHSDLILNLDSPDSNFYTPLLLYATYSSLDATGSAGSFYNVELLCLKSESSVYYGIFHDSTDIPGNLPSGWYVMNLKIADPAAQALQKQSTLLSIQLATISSLGSNPVVYDENQVHSFLYLDQTPKKQLQFAVTFSNPTTQYTLGATNTVFIDITLDTKIIDSLEDKRFVMSILNSSGFAFVVGTACVNLAKTSLPVIAAITSSLYTCTVSSDKVTLIILKQALATQSTFRFSAAISNPSTVTSNIPMTIFAMRKYSPRIIQSGTISSALNTQSLSLQSFKLSLAWDMTDLPTQPTNIYVVRGYAPTNPTPGPAPYNQFNVKFQVNVNSPAGVEQRVLIVIKTKSTSVLLPGSISHNLPGFTDRVVTCVELNPLFQEQRRISCSQVGILDSTVSYFITFKMSFAYDVFTASLQTTSFGAIEVESMNMITSSDSVFTISLSHQFAELMRDTYGGSVQVASAALLDNLSGFSSAVFLVNSADFSGYTQEIYPTSRPVSYAGKFSSFTEYFVPANPVQFLAYITTLPGDIYVCQIKKMSSFASLALTKGPSGKLTINRSFPQNILTIPTVNISDMRTAASDSYATSFSTGSNAPPANRGLKYSSDALYTQNLSVFLTGKYSDVTSIDPSITTLPNQVGILFMMNPQIKFSSPTVASAASASVVSTAISPFTCVQVNFSLQSQLQTYFPTVSTSTEFILKNFNFQPFTSSANAISSNLDIYIQTIDGISGVLSSQQRNAYILVNAYLLSTTDLPSLKLSPVNYWATASSGNDGSLIPFSVLITGNLNVGTANKLSLFFDAGTPFIFSADSEVSCASTLSGLNNPYCTYAQHTTIGSSTGTINYLQLSRIDILINSPSAATSFEILIPMQVSTGVTTFNYKIAIFNANNALLYAKAFTSFTYTLQGSALSSSITASTSSQSYGINCSTCKVGSTSSQQLNAYHAGGSVTADTASLTGAGFTFIADYPFFSSSSTFTSVPSSFGSGTQSCMFFQYRISAANKYGVFCPLVVGGSIPSTGPTITNMRMPSYPVINAYGSYSTNSGLLVTLLSDTAPTIAQTDLAAPILLPIIIAGQTAFSIVFTITAPVDLPKTFIVKISNAGGLNLLSRSSFQTCQSSLSMTRSIQSTCSLLDTTNLTDLKYQITTPGGIAVQNTIITIRHYGLDTQSTGADILTASISIFDSTLTTTIAAITPITISFKPLDSTTDKWTGVYSTSFSIEPIRESILNKNAYSMIYAFIDIQSKSIVSGESIVLSLGGFSAANLATYTTISAQIFTISDVNTLNSALSYTPTQLQQLPLSHDLSSLKIIKDNTNILQLTMTFKINRYSKYLVYLLALNNIINPTATATLTFSYFTLPIIAVPNLLFPATTIVSTALSTAVSIASAASSSSTLSKLYNTPGSSLEIILSIKTSFIPIDYSSRIIIRFPSYYAPLLSRDGDNIDCFQGSSLLTVSCTVTQPRILEIKYFQSTIAVNSYVNLTISGVTQPQSYSSGLFVITLDNDSDDASASEQIQLYDVVVSLNERILSDNLLITSSTLSSMYLLQKSVTYTFRMELESTMTGIQQNQYIIVNFPQIYSHIFRSVYKTPSCSIIRTDSPNKQYAGICVALGLRVKIAVSTIMVPGFLYDISLLNVPNPPQFGPEVYDWIIEVSSQKQRFVMYRTFASSSNYSPALFTQNPSQQLLKFTDEAGNTVTSLKLIKGIYSQKIFIKRVTTTEPTFARSFAIYNQEAAISTIPTSPNVIVGKQDFNLQFFSQSGVGKYYLQLLKSGDGSYYSDLQPLEIEFSPANQQVISFQETPLLIELSSTQKYLQLSTLLPIAALSIAFSFPTGYDTKGFTLSASSTLVFTNDIPFAVLSYSFATAPTVGDQIVMEMALTGDSAASYKIPTQNIQIQFVAADISVLTTSILATPSMLSPTTATISVGCLKPAAFFWGISLKYISDLTMCVITQAQLLTHISEDPNVALKCYYQFGSAYLQAGATLVIPISSLRVSSTYRIYGVCVDSSGNQQYTTVPVEMTTNTNSGAIKKLQIDFASQPTPSQIHKLTCFLSLFFHAQPTNTKTFDSTYCQEAYSPKRFLSSTSDNILTCAQSGSDLPLVTQSGMVSEYFFFGQNMDTDSDTTSNSVFAATRKACFKTFVNANLLGVAQVLNIHTAVMVSTTIPTVSTTPTTTIGHTWAFMNSMTLSATGSVYLILDLHPSTTPSPLQVLSSLNSQGNQALVGAGLRYDSAVGIPVNFTFTPITPSQAYDIYYLVANDSPFIDQLSFSTVQSITFTAEATPTNSLGYRINSGVMSILVIAFAILLL